MGAAHGPSCGTGGKQRVKGHEGSRWAEGSHLHWAGGSAALLAALCSRFPLYYVTEPLAALKIQHYKLIVMLPH